MFTMYNSINKYYKLLCYYYNRFKQPYNGISIGMHINININICATKQGKM